MALLLSWVSSALLTRPAGLVLERMLMLPDKDRAVSERSVLIKNMLEDLGDDAITQTNPIPIPNVRRIFPAEHLRALHCAAS